MKKAILVIPVIALLTGCATTEWYHPSKTTSEFYQDNSRCMAMGGSAGSTQMIPVYNTGGYNNLSNSFADGWNRSAAIGNMQRRNQITEQCMRGNGWYTVKSQ